MSTNYRSRWARCKTATIDRARNTNGFSRNWNRRTNCSLNKWSNIWRIQLPTVGQVENRSFFCICCHSFTSSFGCLSRSLQTPSAKNPSDSSSVSIDQPEIFLFKYFNSWRDAFTELTIYVEERLKSNQQSAENTDKVTEIDSLDLRSLHPSDHQCLFRLDDLCSQGISAARRELPCCPQSSTGRFTSKKRQLTWLSTCFSLRVDLVVARKWEEHKFLWIIQYVCFIVWESSCIGHKKVRESDTNCVWKDTFFYRVSVFVTNRKWAVHLKTRKEFTRRSVNWTPFSIIYSKNGRGIYPNYEK